MDAFNSDVLIYAAVPGRPLGRRVAALFRSAAADTHTGSGSVLLLPEILGKPLRDGATEELRPLMDLLARLDLHPVDRPTADLASVLSGRYRLRAADATHLAPRRSRSVPIGSSPTTAAISRSRSRRSRSPTRKTSRTRPGPRVRGSAPAAGRGSRGHGPALARAPSPELRAAASSGDMPVCFLSCAHVLTAPKRQRSPARRAAHR